MMKKILSALLVFVFLHVQAQAYAPDYGGIGFNAVGTYGGVFIPTVGANAAAGAALTDLQAASIGIFSIGVPQTGLPTGSFAIFIDGGAYVGTIIGEVDPAAQTLSAILSGTSTFSVVVDTFIPNGMGGFTISSVTFRISVTGTMKADFTQGANPALGVANQILTGTASVFTFGQINVDGSPDISATQDYLVNGVQQSGTVSPTTITLTTASGG